jgi:hypothetical protein
MTFYPKKLSKNHSTMLFDESSIDPDLAAERGYRTIRSRAELSDFPKWQRRLGLYVPMYSPDGITQSAQLRPSRPRKNGAKYETPHKARMIVDVHPRMHEEARSGDGDLWLTEGVRKSDCLTSRGLCTVALAGVWNWIVKGTRADLLPCFDHIALNGRRVFIVFDADVMVKENVQLALGRLVTALERRGANVLVIYLPGQQGGVDDYLVAGGTVNELKMLARKFDPQDIGRIRLSQDERLRGAVAELWGKFWGYEWGRVVGTGERPNSMRGHSCRDAIKVAIDTATRSGKPVEDGVRFTLCSRTWALRASTSKQTILKTIGHMEAEGWLRRDYENKPEDVAGSYVLLCRRATLDQDGKKQGLEGKATQELQECGPDGKDLRAPRLRWSAPVFEREGDRLVRGYVYRLGKIAGAIVDLLCREGEMDINEVAEALRRRVRDLRRRNLPTLEEAGVITVVGDTVRLADDWLEALEVERFLKGEIEAEKRDRSRYRLQSEAFRNRNTIRPDHHYANIGADGHVDDLRPVVSETEVPPQQEPEVSMLAQAIRDYLDRNPHDSCQPPGWIGITLWAYNLYPGKPTPAEVQTAIGELGGETYLWENLRRAGEAA